MAVILVVKMKRRGNILGIMGELTDSSRKEKKDNFRGECFKQEDNYKMKYSMKLLRQGYFYNTY